MSTSKVFKKLKSLREKIKWDIEEDRNAFIWELEDLITGDWCSIKELPHLQDIFQEGEIDQLLYDAVPNWSDATENYSGEIFINLVIRSGYKDQPRLDETGKPILRRTTAIHRADKRKFGNHPCLSKLFKIFTRFDVNYVDEATGMTHFHVACKNGCADVVEKFLEFGEDPNGLIDKTGDSPLHVVLAEGKKRIAELLLRSGADPNLTNKDGTSPLHVICDEGFEEPMARILFECSHEKYLLIRVNVLDKFGRTPLHYALCNCKTGLAEALLRNGADPDLADADGLTPLHIICKRKLTLDVEDKKGRTPLQVAVANLSPRLVGLLLDLGADMSKFVFPSESDFNEGINNQFYEIWGHTELEIISGALGVIERLESRGYALKRSDVLTIVKIFAKYEVFVHNDWVKKMYEIWCENRKLNSKYYDKIIMVSPSMSFGDLIRLEEDGEKVFASWEYFEFLRVDFMKIFEYPSEDFWPCIMHLKEKLPRRFCRRWALDPLLELSRHQLPILCCDMILKKLMNEDLCSIILAVPSHENSKQNLINCINKRPVRSRKAPDRLQIVR
uniref:Uncharacterized protein n=1 Tax=Trichogramma kaykai TaxID=54128 RepID=A0ABD2W7F6_9HYME